MIFAAGDLDKRFPDQPFIAAELRHTIGSALLELGDMAQAEAHLTAAYRTYRAEYGDDHRETLALLNNLGLLYKTNGQYDKAEATFQACLAGRRKVLGDHDGETYQTIGNLATVYHDLGRAADAERLYLQAHDGLTATLGEGHEATLSILGNLGVFYANQKLDFPKAEGYLTRALRGQAKLRGDVHPLTLQVQINLAWTYLQANKLVEADARYSQTVTELDPIGRTGPPDDVERAAQCRRVL